MPQIKIIEFTQKKWWKKALLKYKKDYINENKALVQNSKPQSESFDLTKVVGIIKEISIDKNNNIVANIEGFTNNINDSKTLMKLLEEGKLQARMSGIGTITQQDGIDIVQNDWEFLGVFLTNEGA